MSDEYKALSKEWPIDELNALRARVKELEAQLVAAESEIAELSEALSEVQCERSQLLERIGVREPKKYA